MYNDNISHTYDNTAPYGEVKWVPKPAKLKIYISLPITGHEAEARQHADLIKASLSRAGHDVVNPFEIYVGKSPTYADYLCADLRALAECDAIFLCNGWQFSRGCRIERTFAEEFGLQVMYEKGV